jgi:hypothetical protein
MTPDIIMATIDIPAYQDVLALASKLPLEDPNS